MDRFQKQSIILMITNIESQLANLRQLVGMTGPSTPSGQAEVLKAPHSDLYTSAREDAEIDQALNIEDERDVLLQDVFKRATETDM